MKSLSFDKCWQFSKSILGKLTHQKSHKRLKFHHANLNKSTENYFNGTVWHGVINLA
ncbi:hypothetical protein H6G83_07805 [Anabaena azotica FACHB-119]|uniref:Transposase n=1 Tax=Anabaena azotica FACHB-119 TaxID=947527 RepID=A0ABR8D057_9NOST|nr:hypothetical protein [Anabaena azotica FACHB-119]